MEWLNVLKDSPIAIAVIIVVVLFLRFLHAQRKDADKQSEARELREAERDLLFTSTIKHLGNQAETRAKECHAVHNQSIGTIERNTAAFVAMEKQFQELCRDQTFQHAADSRAAAETKRRDARDHPRQKPPAGDPVPTERS